MFEIITLEVTPFLQNCRILISRESGAAVVIDPGGEPERILGTAAKTGLPVTEIWLTHSHLDHCGGVKTLKKDTGAKLLAHPNEALYRARVPEIAAMYGIPAGHFDACPEPDREIVGGETLELGSARFKVLFTPGHSPGHLCFYHAESDTLIAGDTLFAGSIGRTDLPGGDHRTLLESIRREILTLPPQTKVLPGHGPDTTVAEEARSNPFLEGE